MAKVNREFLVPYVQNLCSLYLVKEKIENEIHSINARINKVEYGVEKEQTPRPPKTCAIVDGTDVLFFALSVFFALGFILLSVLFIADEMGEFNPFFLFVLFGAFSLMFFISAIRDVIYNINYKKEENERYESECQKFKQSKKNNEEIRNRELPVLYSKLDYAKQELNKVNHTIRQVYAANIIPLKYRDMYATVYLYDWFVYGVSDNLDMALNTYVLEEIKDKLDQIIQNQASIILNQCKQIALQQKTLEAQEKHHKKMIDKVDRIIETNEERNMYLNMIDCNTAAVAYFAAAQYWLD